MTLNKDIEEQWEKEWALFRATKLSRHPTLWYLSKKETIAEMHDFIQTLLDQQRQSIIEELEGMRVPSGLLGAGFETYREGDKYNQGLLDAISKIKEMGGDE